MLKLTFGKNSAAHYEHSSANVLCRHASSVLKIIECLLPQKAQIRHGLYSIRKHTWSRGRLMISLIGCRRVDPVQDAVVWVAMLGRCW